MQYRTLNRTGWQVSVFSYAIPYQYSEFDDEANELGTFYRIERCVKQGINYLQIPAGYPKFSPKVLGQVIQANPDLDIYAEIELPSKVPPLKQPSTAQYPPAYVRTQVELLLQQMNRPHLDVLSFRTWLDSWVDDKALLSVLADLKQEGLVQAYKIPVEPRLDDQTGLPSLSTGLFDLISVRYSPFNQIAADTLFPYCQTHNVGVRVNLGCTLSGGNGLQFSPLLKHNRKSSPLIDVVSSRREPLLWRLVLRILNGPPPNYDYLETPLKRFKGRLPAELSLRSATLRFVLSHPIVTTVSMPKQSRIPDPIDLPILKLGSLPAQLLTELKTHQAEYELW